MASVFERKRKLKLATGKTVVRQSVKYYTRLTDADGIKRTIPLFTDKTASEQRAAQLQKEIELAGAGVVDRYKEHRRKPLSEHIEDFRQSLLAKGDTVRHARQTAYRVKRIIDGCGFVTWNDLQPSKVHRYLAELRDGPESMSAQTFNFYLQSMKRFGRWMVQDQRVGESPFEHLRGVNVRTDRRHDRRTLEPDELRILLEATAAGPKRFGMSGFERYLLYRFAAETGLRANEIRNLKIRDFDLDSLSVTAKAAYSKRRREDVQPLRPDTAELLKEFFKGKTPNVKAFGGTCRRLTRRTSDMIKADLADAGIPYVDDAGRFADFHSLRHTTGSLLAASGVHPKVAQSIMRHSDINLTMSRYTHTLAGQETKAVAGLPDLSLPSSQSQRAKATGTESSGEWTLKRTPTAFSECDSLATADSRDEKPSETRVNHNCLSGREIGIEKFRSSSNDNENGEGGIRTRGAGVYPHDGLANRCLKPLGHLSEQFYGNLLSAGLHCNKITAKPDFFAIIRRFKTFTNQAMLYALRGSRGTAFESVFASLMSCLQKLDALTLHSFSISLATISAMICSCSDKIGGGVTVWAIDSTGCFCC